MVIIGAKGHAKDVLCVLEDNGFSNRLYFYDDVSEDLPSELYGIYTILKTFEDVTEVLKHDPDFIIGVGNPFIRQLMCNKFTTEGGILQSLISRRALIGKHEVTIEPGVNIMANVTISNNVIIGEGTLINAGVLVHHDVRIGKFVEVSPGTVVTGGVTIDDFSIIGSGAILLPKIKIGKNVIIGAGAVVTKSIPNNTRVKGIPATSF
ncbi:NeuD/PglB/VioB family sugar acetyltransferase [Pontibacter sp. E15-1]|uniref:NeuD/PglB/VioB family sugar acetyltransferase n=1 Tax=Pontibacter sp. E15-1 TaxID=2919918 RepID=UPI001F502A32|nr:NeuD/PglB/VioB family sugar acetyltransferase [Pontibacter sp. E15-1]MCJ8166331.1 NeuD/PglB/VioB family sugar acetyltransferase [Pontibacter sp. E15-1]